MIAAVILIALTANYAVATPTQTTLVSNLGQSGLVNFHMSVDHAQMFQTGSDRYRLNSITFNVRAGAPDSTTNTLALVLYAADSAGRPTGSPLTTLATFSGDTHDLIETTGDVTVALDAPYVLHKNTYYALVFDYDTNVSSFLIAGIPSGSEDDGGVPGWSIHDKSSYTSSEGSWWSLPNSSSTVKISLGGYIVSNETPTGTLAIDGVPGLGKTLTANTSDIADGNGLSSPNWTYQWIRQDDESGTNAEDIAGATGSTYTLTESDIQKYISVNVSFTDDDEYEEELTSDAVGPIETALIANMGQSGAASLFGSVDRSQAFTTGGSLHELNSFTFTIKSAAPESTTNTLTVSLYAVDSNGAPTGSALTTLATFTGDTHDLIETTGDVTATLSTPYTLATNTTYAIVFDYDVNTSSFVLDGTTGTGEDSDTLSGWRFRDGSHTTIDEGVSWTAQPRMLRLSLSGFPSSPNENPTGTPSIDGVLEIGQTLTANTSDIADGNGLSSPNWTYQWIRQDDESGTNAEDIAGETSSTYTLTKDDLTTYISVNVGFTDDDTYMEELTSDIVGPVTTVTLISNLDQAVNQHHSAPFTHNRAQSFQTGPDGYTLDSVTFEVMQAAPDSATNTLTVSLYSINYDNSYIGVLETLLATIATFTGDTHDLIETTGEVTVTLDTPYVLHADTYYAIVFEYDPHTYDFKIKRTNSDDEDAGGIAGWSIADHLSYNLNGSSYWGYSTYSVALSLNGYPTPPQPSINRSTIDNGERGQRTNPHRKYIRHSGRQRSLVSELDLSMDSPG